MNLRLSVQNCEHNKNIFVIDTYIFAVQSQFAVYTFHGDDKKKSVRRARVPFTSSAMSRKRISGCASDKKNLPFMTIVFLQRRQRRRRQTKKLIALSNNKISMFGFYKLYVRRTDITKRKSHNTPANIL